MGVASGQQIHPAEALFQEGPIVDLLIRVPKAIEEALHKERKPIPAPVIGRGLIDTGASNTAVDEAVLRDALQLQPIGTRANHGAHGVDQRNVYACGLEIPTVATADLPQVVGVNLAGSGLAVLIGRDFLLGKIMIYDGTIGAFTVCW